MTPLAVAFCPATPLLSPAVAIRPDGVADVQAAATEVVAALLGSAPDGVLVLGEAPRPGQFEGTWDWHAFGVRQRGGGAAGLPRALGVGAWLLDAAGWSGPRRYVGVPPTTTPPDCADLAGSLRAQPGSPALLVVADGSARRSLTAPGHLDERAEPFDAGVADALARADPAALGALDPALADELLATGRATWQVVAGLTEPFTWLGSLLRDEAPFGVGWFVAHWFR